MGSRESDDRLERGKMRCVRVAGWDIPTYVFRGSPIKWDWKESLGYGCGRAQCSSLLVTCMAIDQDWTHIALGARRLCRFTAGIDWRLGKLHALPKVAKAPGASQPFAGITGPDRW